MYRGAIPSSSVCPENSEFPIEMLREDDREKPPPPTTPNPSSTQAPLNNRKARMCLPPLQPLSVSRGNLDEWPKAGPDDLGVWPNVQTPRGTNRNPLPNLNSGREFQFKRDKLAFFDKECSKIAEHIYLGSDAVAKNREILRQNGITHVLNCVGFVSPEYFKEDLVYKTLWLQDSPSEDITSILYDVFDYFEDVREQGGRVLVHCCQGVSRSTSLVIAYLMWREVQSFEDAFQHVKAARGVTNPNVGFACQLLQRQKRVNLPSPTAARIIRMYRMAPHSPYDPLHLVPKQLVCPGAKELDSRGAFILHVPDAIYVWVGKKCPGMMSDKAIGAAFQVVRYERAKGPILQVKEGQEPPDFWDSLANMELLSDGDERVEEIAERNSSIQNDVVCAPGCVEIGGRKVKYYDLDFEIFHKALAGGVVVVGPFSVSDTNSEFSSFLKGSPGSTGDSFKEDGEGSFTSSPRSFSQSPVGSRMSSSKSPTLSPFTSEYSGSSFTFSPSSSSWSDLPYSSSQQPSPSGLESGFQLPQKGNDVWDKLSLPYNGTPGEALPAPAADQDSRIMDSILLSKDISLSIAQRRGSNLPPRMLLPTVDEQSHFHHKLAGAIMINREC